MSSAVQIIVVIALMLLVPGIAGVFAGRAEGAAGAVRILAMFAAPLAVAGVVMAYVGFGPLSRAYGYTAVALLIGGFSLLALGAVLALAACATGLTIIVRRRAWAELWRLGLAPLLFLAAAGLYDTLSFSVSNSIPYKQAVMWVEIASGIVALGAVLVMLWSIHAGRTPLNAGRLAGVSSP
ncbi:MAG TPA: hypothetical protein VFU88_05140 [Ktedonobacterales bacterium]|nr:hypothetical protein [Ktedonobacterales bacterium]